MLAHQLDRLAQQQPRSRDFTLNSLRHAPARGDRLLPGLPLLHHRRGHPRDGPPVRRAGGAAGAAPATRPEPRLSSTSSATCCCWSTRPRLRRGRPGRAAPLRRQVPAGDRAGDGQGRRGHRLLRLQPAGVAQRGRRRRRAASACSPRRCTALSRSGQSQLALGALSALSTHDTKRSEDVRARLNVLSEMPRGVAEPPGPLERAQRRAPRSVDDGSRPRTRNEEYLLYQTLLGAWPLEPAGAESLPASSSASRRTWTRRCTRPRSTPAGSTPTRVRRGRAAVRRAHPRAQASRAVPRATFGPSSSRVSHFGLFNSLAQTLLKLTAPGVPDTYQGTELWDFSLVDPDNRRPVDHDRRNMMLLEMRKKIVAGDDLAGFAGGATPTKGRWSVSNSMSWRLPLDWPPKVSGAFCMRRISAWANARSEA